MKKNKKYLSLRITFVSVSLWAIICAFAMACTAKNITENSQPTTLWTIWNNNPKEYTTTDIKVAQEETPFKIILPSYLPTDLNPLPVVQGRGKSDFTNEEPVQINYSRKNSQLLIIHEYNYTLDKFETDNSTDLEYNNTKIVEAPIEKLYPLDTFPGYIYNWNDNGINITLYIYDHTKEEGWKIVESMINH